MASPTYFNLTYALMLYVIYPLYAPLVKGWSGLVRKEWKRFQTHERGGKL